MLRAAAALAAGLGLMLLAGCGTATGSATARAAGELTRRSTVPTALRAAMAVPQLVALVNATAPRDDLFGARFCGGVLVRRAVVLTAAHCVSAADAGRIDAVIGPDNLCRTAPVHGERIGVRAVAIRSDRDVAALLLNHRSSTRPMPISHGPVRWPGLVVGWGRIDLAQPAPCTRHGVVLRAGDRRPCRREARPDLGADLCAVPLETQDRNTCIGDSGSPLLQADRSRHYAVTALVSWGPSCRPRAVGFYASVRGLTTWLGALSARPDRSPSAPTAQPR